MAQRPDDLSYARTLMEDIQGGGFSTLKAKEQVLGDFSGILRTLEEQGISFEDISRFGNMTADDVLAVRDGLAEEVVELREAARNRHHHIGIITEKLFPEIPHSLAKGELVHGFHPDKVSILVAEALGGREDLEIAAIAGAQFDPLHVPEGADLLRESRELVGEHAKGVLKALEAENGHEVVGSATARLISERAQGAPERSGRGG